MSIDGRGVDGGRLVTAERPCFLVVMNSPKIEPPEPLGEGHLSAHSRPTTPTLDTSDQAPLLKTVLSAAEPTGHTYPAGVRFLM